MDLMVGSKDKTSASFSGWCGVWESTRCPSYCKLDFLSVANTETRAHSHLWKDIVLPLAALYDVLWRNYQHRTSEQSVQLSDF